MYPALAYAEGGDVADRHGAGRDVAEARARVGVARGDGPVAEPRAAIASTVRGGDASPSRASGERHRQAELSAAWERVCFLELRLEQVSSVVQDQERVIREQREQLALGAEREAAKSRHLSELELRLADARRQAVTLGQRAVYADAVRGDASGRSAADAPRQIARLEADLGRAREDQVASQRALDAAQERIAILESGRERFFAKLVEWQQTGGSGETVDLAEFIAELRSEISRLASENGRLIDHSHALRRALDESAARARDSAPAPVAAATAPVFATAPCRGASEALREAPHGASPPQASPGHCAPSAPSADVPSADVPAADVPAATHAHGHRFEGLAARERAADRAAPVSAATRAPRDTAEPGSPRDAGVPSASGPRTVWAAAHGAWREAAARLAAGEPPAPRPLPPAARVGPMPVGLSEIGEQLADALAGRAGGRTAQALLAELVSRDASLRRAASRALLQVAGADAAPALALAYHAATDLAERSDLLALLARTHASTAAGLLAGALDDPEPHVRAAAVDALVTYHRHRPERLDALLLHAQGDAEPRVRRRVMVALCSLSGVDPVPLLAHALRDPDPKIRRLACASHRGTPSHAIDRLLVGALLDADASVRRAAALALRPVLGDAVRGVPEAGEAERRRAVARFRDWLAGAVDPRDAVRARARALDRTTGGHGAHGYGSARAAGALRLGHALEETEP
jgi:hypothetical protein